MLSQPSFTSRSHLTELNSHILRNGLAVNTFKWDQNRLPVCQRVGSRTHDNEVTQIKWACNRIGGVC